MNIWNAEKAFSGTSINAICATIRVLGTVDIPALQRVLDAVVGTEDQLRARITLEDGTPKQYVAPYEHRLFPVFDFTKTDSTGLSHWEDTIAREPMKLIDAPLYDFRIFKQSESAGGILVKLHHIISDGWSQMLLSNRIAETYLALLCGREATLVPGPSYELHVEKEKAYLASRARGKDEDFWRERLEGFDGASVVKNCLSADVSPVGRRKTFRFSHMVNHLIRDFCEKYRVAPFAVYYMALAIYLNRATGARRSAIGVPVFNRIDYQDKSTLGMFVSTLPFLGEIDEEWSFARFNEELTGQWFELLRHQRLPFTEINGIAKRLNPDAGSLFHIVLSYQTSRMYKSEDASVTFTGRWHYSGYQGEHLLIHLSSMEDDYCFSVDYDYLTQIFSEQDIDKLHEYLTNILTDALSDPDMPIWKLPVIGLEEKGKVLFSFNQTAKRLAAADVPAMMRRALKAHPQRVAVIHKGSRLTYEALFAMASAYARAVDTLCPEGSGAVFVCLEKGFPLAAALVAAAISARTWLTLPEDTPPGRLNEILEDSGAAVLICAPGAEPPGCRVPALYPEAAAGFDSAPYPEKPGAKTAYMVYTSGSTGRPKGVLIGQESLVNLACAARALYGHGAVLSLCSQGFDVFVMECAASLMNGRTIVFPEPHEQEDPRLLAKLIRGFAVGNLFLPPSRLEAYMREPEFAKALCCVESIVCGGERFPGELTQAIRQYSEAAVYNQYGPSETTIAVSYKRLNDASSITIGKPMDNCRLYVLDAHLQPLPVGVMGEVYIGGLCVGQGYRNLHELTQKNFLPSPFEPGDMLYRSGDAGAWTPEGEIALGGRLDDQVKLRGLRIEPREIAMRLSSHERIDQAAVRVVERGRGALIAAYYTADSEISEAELTEFLRSYLPVYMLPGTYVRLDQMPVTRSGKIDYLALPEPKVQSDGAPARDDVELETLAVFRTTLRNPDLDVESDYFLSGGDSLTAMETTLALEAKFGAKLAVKDLFVYRTARRTAAALAGIVPQRRPDGARSDKPCLDDVIPVATPRTTYPATPTQVGIYLDSQASPRSLAYNMPGAFRLPEGTDRGKLLAALRELVANERLLRTSFELTGEGLVQRVWENAAFGLEVLSQESFERAMLAFARSFDVTRPPLMRAALWDSPNGDAYLFFDTHHLVGDGLTSPLLMKKLGALYSGCACSAGADFLDYALWQSEKGVDAQARAYWEARLADAPEPPALPYDRPETAPGPYPGKKLVFTLPARSAARIEPYCAQRAATPFMLFASAYALLLYKLTGAKDVVFGTTASGRLVPQSREIIGPLLRTLPLRLSLSPQGSAAELVEQVRGRTLELIEHQEADVAALARQARGTSGRVFNALFSMRPFGDGDFAFLNEKIDLIPADTGYAKFPLSLEAAKTGGGYAFTLEYAANLIDADAAALWARSYSAIVGALLANDAVSIAELDPLCEQDRYDLIDRPDRLNTPFADIPLDYTIAHAALVKPDAPAIRFHGDTTSFAALMARAEHIARALAARGLGRDDVVGVVHARTPDLLATLVGVMRAGCAYMPALANYPAERLAFMANTAGAKLILADDASAASLAGMPLPCEVLAVNALAEHPGAALPTLLERRGEDGIYVLFTSGSTGEPKGARNTHAAIANLLNAMAPIVGAQANAVLCSTNVTFDIFITESLLALALGKCVVLADEEEMLLPHKLAELIGAEEVDAAQLTPSRLRMCLGNDAFCAAVARLKAMLVAGEPLSPRLAERFHEASPARLYNLYGPTEACIYATFTACEPGAPRISIGRPVQNCRVYVMDESLRRVMPTARGELCIAGVCLAAGYIGKPELTAAAFVDDPIFPGRRMYRSGDIGRLLPDGTLEYIGRRDSQIKLNGQRVELDEITARLLEHTGVAEAATVAVGGENAEKRLRACVVLAPGARADAAEIAAWLKATLPPFMVPGEIWLIPAMPRNASGKTDVLLLACAASLAQLLGTGRAESAEPAPPAREERIAANTRMDAPPARAGDAAERLLEIWKQVLGRGEIDPAASFFEQGGGSLGALDVLSRCYNAGIHMTLEQFYSNPTLEAQSALVAGMRIGPREPAPVEQPASVEQAVPVEPPAPAEQPAPISAPVEQPTPAPAKPAAAENPCAVLLTGATGYLGAHLLDELAAKRGRNVVCLVRGGDPARLAQAMEAYFGKSWFAENAARVRVVAGDIGEIDFGLANAELTALTGRVETILHCAADVRHFAPNPDASLRSNAGGTANAVRLAARIGAGLAYISTMSVANDRAEAFNEDSPPADPEDVANIYVRGKCSAELLVRRCVNLLPSARIIRVGRLVGRESDGAFQLNRESNAFYALVRGALSLGCYPESLANLPVELTSVDACARAVCLLLDGQGSVYHLFNPIMPAFSEVMRVLSQGQAVCLPDAEFDARLARLMAQRPSAGLVMLGELWSGLRSASATPPVPSAERTVAELAAKGFVWLEPDIALALREFASV